MRTHFIELTELDPENGYVKGPIFFEINYTNFNSIRLGLKGSEVYQFSEVICVKETPHEIVRLITEAQDKNNEASLEHYRRQCEIAKRYNVDDDGESWKD